MLSMAMLTKTCPSLRRAVLRHDGKGLGRERRQLRHVRRRLRHRRRAAQKLRVGAVVRGEAAQPAQDHRHVHPERAVVHVRLVEHDVPERREQRRHALVRGQDAAPPHTPPWSV